MGVDYGFSVVRRSDVLKGNGPRGRYDWNIGEYVDSKAVAEFGSFERDDYLGHILGLKDIPYDDKEVEDFAKEAVKTNGDFGDCRLLSRSHIEHALKVINELDAKVAAMPFDELDEETRKKGWASWPSYSESEGKWTGGSEKNIAIAKLVYETLGNSYRFYHYRFPWNAYPVMGEWNGGLWEFKEIFEEILKYLKSEDEKYVAFITFN